VSDRFGTGRALLGVGSGLVVVSYLMPWLDTPLFKQTGLELLSAASRGAQAASSPNVTRFTRDIQDLAGAILIVVGAPLFFNAVALLMLMGARSRGVRWAQCVMTLMPLLIWGGLLTLLFILASDHDRGARFVGTMMVRAGENLAGNGVMVCAAGMLVAWVGTIVMLTSRDGLGQPLPHGAAQSPHFVQPMPPPTGFEPTVLVTPNPVHAAQSTPTPAVVVAPIPARVAGSEAGRVPRGAWIGGGVALGALLAVGIAFALLRSDRDARRGAEQTPPSIAPTTPPIPTGLPQPTQPAPEPSAAPARTQQTPTPTTPTTGLPPMATLNVVGTRASTEMNTGSDPHPAAHAFDGNSHTAWNESARGPGQGEWIEATLDGTHVVERVTLATGWDHISPRWGDLFTANSHMRRVRVVFSDGTSVSRDVAADQRSVVFDGLGRTTSSVRIVADDVYPGARWQDLCVSDVTIEGR